MKHTDCLLKTKKWVYKLSSVILSYSSIISGGLDFRFVRKNSDLHKAIKKDLDFKNVKRNKGDEIITGLYEVGYPPIIITDIPNIILIKKDDKEITHTQKQNIIAQKLSNEEILNAIITEKKIHIHI